MGPAFLELKDWWDEREWLVPYSQVNSSYRGNFVASFTLKTHLEGSLDTAGPGCSKQLEEEASLTSVGRRKVLEQLLASGAIPARVVTSYLKDGP